MKKGGILRSVQNLCWLMITEDYTTQYIGDYDTPIYRGIPFLTNQYFMEQKRGLTFNEWIMELLVFSED